MPSSNAWVESLGWMLIHSVWLIALIAGVATLSMTGLRRRSATARYAVGIVALGLSLAALPGTLVWVVALRSDRHVVAMPVGDEFLALKHETNDERSQVIDVVGEGDDFSRDHRRLTTSATRRPVEAVGSMPFVKSARSMEGLSAQPPAPTFWQRTESRLRPHLPFVVVAWLIGVVLLSVRPLIGWHSARRLQRVGLSEVSDSLQEMLSRLAGRLGLKHAVRLFQSSLVQIPCVVGAFKPVILLPASAIIGLSPDQLEALLAHELAHIRRYDFAVNVVQTLVETLLFYHPAIWWLSHRVRQEREHCCDDLAISVCGDVAGYARMLVSVEGLRGRVPQTSVAASGGSLVERIRRLLPASHEQPRSPWLPGIIVLGTLVVFTLGSGVGSPSPDAPNEKQDDKKPKSEIMGRLVDVATEMPVEGATIAGRAIAADSEKSGAIAVTDADGRYRLAVPPGIYIVWLEKFDKVPAMMAAADIVPVEAGKVATSQLHLTAGRKVSGKVIGSNGKPPRPENLDLKYYSSAKGGPQEVETQDDGSFEFAVPPGRIQIYAWVAGEKSKENPLGTELTADAHFKVSLTEEVAPLTLTLKITDGNPSASEWLKSSTPGTQIVRREGDRHVTGTIVDEAGQPIPQAKLFEFRTPFIAANDKGEFHIETKQNTLLNLMAFAPGFDLWTGKPWSGDVLKIVLERRPPAGNQNAASKSVTYKCRVVASGTKAPIAGATVVFKRSLYGDPRHPGEHDHLLEKTTHVTDADGRYEVTIPPEQLAERYLYIELDASHPEHSARNGHGYAMSMIRKNEQAGGRPFFETTVLPPGKAVTGTVVKPDGQPAAGVKITGYCYLSSQSTSLFSSGFQSQTDADGKFRLVVPNSGDGTFWLQPTDHCPAGYVAPPERGDMGRLTLKAGLRPSGQVFDADGRPVAGLLVNMERDGAESADMERINREYSAGSGYEREGVTDADGRFVLAPVDPGKYRLQITSHHQWPKPPPKFSGAFLTQTLSFDSTTKTLDIRAVPSVDVQVRNVDQEGQPKRGFEFLISGEIGDQVFHVESDRPADGRCVARAPRGLKAVEIRFFDNEHGSFRVRRKPGAPLEHIDRLKFPTIDEDLEGIEVVRYKAPIVLVKAVDAANQPIADFTPTITYTSVRDPRVEQGEAAGKVRLEHQNDGRWRSEQLLPNEDITISVIKKGWTAEPQKLRMTEGQERELVFVLKPQADGNALRGKIRWVDHERGVASINLGEADSVKTRMRFVRMCRRTTRITRQSSKEPWK